MKKILSLAFGLQFLWLAVASAQNPVWHQLSDQKFNSRARVIVNFNSELYIGGQFTTPEPYWVKFTEGAFDGMYNAPFPVWSAVSFNGEIYIGGDESPYLAKWNGSTWEIPISLDGPIYALYEWNSKLYVGGSFSAFDDRATQNIISWDGTLADTVGNGVAEDVKALNSFDGKLLVCQSGGGGISVWDGQKYVSFEQPVSFSIDASTTVGNIAYFAGVIDDPEDTLNTTKHMIVSYDGSWKTTAITPTGYFGVLRNIEDNLYIGGGFETIEGYPADAFSNIAKYAGGSIESVGEGVGGEVRDISVYQGNLVVAGWFALSDNDPLNIGVLMYSTVTGINDPEATEAFHVFPNPATSQITISNLQRGKVVTIASLSGQTICSFIASNSQATLDVSSFSSGVYFVKVGTSPQMMQFIVQK